MLVVEKRADLAAARDALPGRVAVVMTMGALHEGHAELVRAARRAADHVVVTVFVNPLQFGAGEDLDRYPRTLAADLEVCEREGAAVVFTPTPDVVYPDGPPLVRVSAGPVGEVLEGASRPGHFDGVLTVVCKLLHLVRPDVAVFGQKDAQQLAAIRRMVRDLDLAVEVVAVPTVREPDGLALSSRNRYLSDEQRRSALVLVRALRTGDADAGRALVAAEPGVELDYLERVDSATFAPASDGDLLVVAARVGSTRLIDNVVVHPHRKQPAMQRTMLKSKIHRATVTQADLHYVGSVTVDEDLLDAADLLPGEQVAIVDVTNGARLETYCIAGERGSGVIGINGAAARLVQQGDLVILIAYGLMDDAEARSYEPRVVHVDADNRVVRRGGDPAEALPGTGLRRGDVVDTTLVG